MTAQIVNAEFPVTIENYNSEGKKVALFIKTADTHYCALAELH